MGTNLTALLEAQTDRHVKGNRGQFILSDQFVVLPDDTLWDWLDSIGAQFFHLVAMSGKTGLFHNMPSVQKRVQRSKFSGQVRNVGNAMSVRKANRFGTYCPYLVNAKGDDGFRSWFCFNVVAIRIGQVDYIPARVDAWLNKGVFPWGN